MKKSVGTPLLVLIMLISVVSFSVTAYAAGYYIHDPMKNPKAAADIVEDPDAVYGYSPNPDSPRLGSFADQDWSDEAFVAEMRQEREAYHESVKELYQLKADMEAEGRSLEDIARAVSTRRNEIRMEAYKDDPEGLEKLKESNLKTFGNENGGTPEYFYNKYGSWETVIEKAFSTNAGADAVLGLYDKYYDTYIFDGKQEDDGSDQEPTTSPEETSAAEQGETTPAGLVPTEAPSLKSPQTGDNSAVLILIVFAAAAAAVICASALIREKQREN